MDAFTQEIRSCEEVLRKGGLILYPTDMGWGIGCDATNETAVNRIYDLKSRSKGNDLICLVGSDAMLERHVAQVPEAAWDIIDLATKPTVIVYDRPQGLARNLAHPDNSVAVRVVTDKFCRYLINALKKPVVYASVQLDVNRIPDNMGEIQESILKGVDYVVNLQLGNRNAIAPSIIKLGNDGTVKVIRE